MSLENWLPLLSGMAFGEAAGGFCIPPMTAQSVCPVNDSRVESPNVGRKAWQCCWACTEEDGARTCSRRGEQHCKRYLHLQKYGHPPESQDLSFLLAAKN